MKLINWDKEKNTWLKEKRKICFEDILYYLDNDHLIDDTEHPNQEKYRDQRIMVIDIEGYAYLVPYVETEDEIFLKTIIPDKTIFRRFK